MLCSNTSGRATALLAAFLAFSSHAMALETTVVAEARYLMADSDTLAQAEETVLQRAKQRAVEEAGVYLESTFLDVEKALNGRNVQASSLQIRTIAAAITKTEILESLRSFENNRPSFYVRIRAIVDLDHLQDAIHRWHSEQQFAEHFQRLQKENTRLKAEIRGLKTPPHTAPPLAITPSGQSNATTQAQELVQQAILTPNLLQKLDLASQAIILAPQTADPLVVRGQTYLQLVSTAYSKRAQPSEYSRYVDNARMDFDRALLIDPHNTWALLGQGDVHTWRQQTDEAAHSYKQALALNPFFDTARHRLIILYTTHARKLVTQRQWADALSALHNILGSHVPDSWILDHKEAYLLRSTIYKKLHKPAEAIDDLSMILRDNPTDMRTLLARAKLYREQLQGHLAKSDFERACLLGSAEACRQLPQEIH